ncbi:antibiotic biosynthesis monooxygenase [Rhodococcoides trifolii]|uniref:Antibiotic biosynthesis monooxygenase n=1 Tax=Rhodococcoides trifolii TaxID=908250 RepID=A0A917CJR7_9NOCA|nr:putative quinol monooxygenase [Rhodococcus trifolii]GGF91026.1 antibiotic biosynthesis monooxygenase [Rhodococcus trifolii]
MADLSVVATIPAKAGFEKEVGDALSKLAVASRDEPGCISYVLYESQATPGTFVTIESWKSKADLDVHMEAAAFQQAMAEAGQHLGEVAIHPLTLVV